MLTEDEKQRVDQLEAYRSEVRRRLDACNETRIGRFFRVINSPAAIWFLSSVILSGIGYLYTEHQNSLAKRREAARVVRRLDTEIRARLEQADITTWGWEAASRVSAGLGSIPDDLAERVFLPPQDADVVIPEFGDRTLRSLLYELEGYLEGDEQRAVRRALIDVRHAESRWLALGVSANDLGNFKADLDDIRTHRWDDIVNISRMVDSLTNAVGELTGKLVEQPATDTVRSTPD